MFQSIIYMSDTSQLTLKHRPARFEDVIGQEPAVQFLSQLITRGKIIRNILLHGSHGSGKTSLARLYMRALYCDTPTTKGSPCYTCAGCQDTLGARSLNSIEYELKPKEKLIEHDAGIKPGRAAIIDCLERLTSGDKIVHAPYRVLFIDEAHNLNDGFEVLKKTIEEPPDGFLAILATTDLGAIPASIASRFTTLEISPLSTAAALGLVKSVAEKEQISIDPDALHLLIGITGGYPRDLLQALDDLRFSSSTITTAIVKEKFQIDYEDRLIGFFSALAKGDLAQQADFVDGWTATAETKVRLIQNFLLAIYYNELQGVAATIDPVIASIPKSKRQQVLNAFRQRLNKVGFDIVSFWRSMMDFWHRDEGGGTDASLRLSIVLFHETVNAIGVMPVAPESSIAEGSGDKVAFPAHKRRITRAKGDLASSTARKRKEAVPAQDDKASFLNATHIGQLINAGSFLVQEYGLFLNSEITIWHRPANVEDPKAAGDRMTGFTHAMKERFRVKGQTLHRISILENDDQRGLCSRMVAHIPAGLIEETKAWVEDYFSQIGCDTHEATRVIIEQPKSRKRENTLHWKCVRSLCTGIDPTLTVKLSDEVSRPLWELIGVAKTQLRMAGLIGNARRFHLSASLQSKAVQAAKMARLAPLSAFDDQAWSWIFRGWEADEYHHRETVKKDSKEKERSLNNQLLYAKEGSPESIVLKTKLHDLWNSRPEDPRRRRGRSWAGWWLEGDKSSARH
jgi:DNA polymerase-3 subunit gamma/tau